MRSRLFTPNSAVNGSSITPGESTEKSDSMFSTEMQVPEVIQETEKRSNSNKTAKDTTFTSRNDRNQALATRVLEDHDEYSTRDQNSTALIGNLRKTRDVDTPRTVRRAMAFTTSTLHSAVTAWCDNSTTATATYGHISTWDTSAVTDMSLLFSRYDTDWNDVGGLYCSSYDTFDDDLSAWQMLSSVTDMNRMFNYATSFNSDVSNSTQATVLRICMRCSIMPPPSMVTSQTSTQAVL